MPPSYEITVVTASSHNAGTESAVDLSLYDENAHPVGGAIRLNERMLTAIGDLVPIMAGSSQKVPGYLLGEQTATFTPPLAGRIAGSPVPAFIKVEIKGDDYWKCESIAVRSMERGETSTFTLGIGFSTDAGEGAASKEVTANEYRPSSRDVDTVTRRASTYKIIDNHGGTTASDPVEVELTTVSTDSISIAHGQGDESSRSIEVGVKAGYSAGGATGEVSASYTQAWKNWHSANNVRLYNKSTSRKVTKTSTAPPRTLKLFRWDTSYEVKIVHVSNGIGDEAEIELVPDQQFSSAYDSPRDINADNKISEADWAEWKEGMIAARYRPIEDLHHAEKTLRSLGWIERGQAPA